MVGWREGGNPQTEKCGTKLSIKFILSSYLYFFPTHKKIISRPPPSLPPVRILENSNPYNLFYYSGLLGFITTYEKDQSKDSSYGPSAAKNNVSDKELDDDKVPETKLVPVRYGFLYEQIFNSRKHKL